VAEPRLSEEQRPALTLLASIPRGITADQLTLVHGFDRAIIAALVDEGLAKAQCEVLTGSGRAITKVVRIRITDAGGRRLSADRLPRERRR
jgi:hypothetical protein